MWRCVTGGKYGNASFPGTSFAVWVYTVTGYALNRDKYGARCPLSAVGDGLLGLGWKQRPMVPAGGGIKPVRRPVLPR